jgi:hypothetical protein
VLPCIFQILFKNVLYFIIILKVLLKVSFKNLPVETKKPGLELRQSAGDMGLPGDSGLFSVSLSLRWTQDTGCLGDSRKGRTRWYQENIYGNLMWKMTSFNHDFMVSAERSFPGLQVPLAAVGCSWVERCWSWA